MLEEKVRRDRRERASADRVSAQTRDEIDDPLTELVEVWDIERTLQTNASALAFLGVVLDATVDRGPPVTRVG